MRGYGLTGIRKGAANMPKTTMNDKRESERDKQESKRKGLFGIIPLVHADILAKIIPGFVSLVLVWGVVLHHTHADDISKLLYGEKATWYFWASALVFAYVVGLIVDTLTWKITDCMGEAWYKSFKENPLSDWNEWLQKFQRTFRSSPESTVTDKSQVESRCLTNLAVLLLLVLFLALIGHGCFKAQSLAYLHVTEGSQRWCHLLCGLGLAVILSFWGSWWRQRRRVWGVWTLLDEKPGQSNTDQDKKADHAQDKPSEAPDG